MLDTASWQTILGLLVIVLAAWAVLREFEVRLVLMIASLTLGAIALNPQAIVREFVITLTNEKFIIPLCCGMGFARVLQHTGCDLHLVRLLVKPLTYVRFLLIPGTVVVGFFVNMPIVSQTSTAVTIGSVIIPLLRATGISPITTGAALLLGASVGGELLNPGAPELLTTIEESQKALKKHPEASLTPDDITSERCVRRIIPFNFLSLAVATSVFWFLAARRERMLASEPTDAPPPSEVAMPVNYLKAIVPLVPLVFLYLCSYPFELFKIDHRWLQKSRLPDPETFNTRLIGLAMLLGVVAAVSASREKFKETASTFFEGAGYGYANIVSLIVVANCFGIAIKNVGIAERLGDAIKMWPDALLPTAGIFSVAFAALCGSGMATAQSLFGFFVEPSLALDIDPTHTGAVVSLGSAAGRTMSPVAAVTLMCAKMTGTKPMELSKMVVIPLLVSMATVVALAMVWMPRI